MKEERIIVAGVKLERKTFPKLYEWGQVNPEGLTETLKSLAQASGGDFDDLYSVATNLENDLAHG